MCLLKVKINGVKYSIRTAEIVARNLLNELSATKAVLGDALDEYSNQADKILALEGEVAKLKAENAKLREELGDFPARDESGKYIKRAKHSNQPDKTF